jgi:uncharacterized protein (DUF1501 family)
MSDPILVVIFLRGGIDGLNLVSPTADVDYIAARPEPLRVLRKGDTNGLVMSDMAADVDFRFHQNARPLSELYEAGELAVIHAAGLVDGTRSHFDAEARMERAAKSTASGGWLGRWFAQNPSDGALPLLATGTSAPDSLLGAREVAVADALEDLIIAGGHDISDLMRRRLKEGFGSHPLIGTPINALLSLSQVLEGRIMDKATGEIAPYETSVQYPDTDLAGPLKTVAQAIKLDLGLRIATVDFGGWDTHFGQERRFAPRLETLSQGIMSFWRDLGPAQDRTNIVVMSEFGRRLRANASGGTDHGFGNAMMVMGAGVRGGRMYGDWPGLANDQLDSGADLDITTDYRNVLSDVLRHHMGQADTSAIFPQFEAAQVGLYG